MSQDQTKNMLWTNESIYCVCTHHVRPRDYNDTSKYHNRTTGVTNVTNAKSVRCLDLTNIITNQMTER